MRGIPPGPPKTDSHTSPCSLFVGIPVLGPARCVSTMTTGVSVIPDVPNSSTLRERPGPEVPPIARGAPPVPDGGPAVRAQGFLHDLPPSLRGADVQVYDILALAQKPLLDQRP